VRSPENPEARSKLVPAVVGPEQRAVLGLDQGVHATKSAAAYGHR
jgi:hypothetical protein